MFVDFAAAVVYSDPAMCYRKNGKACYHYKTLFHSMSQSCSLHRQVPDGVHRGHVRLARYRWIGTVVVVGDGMRFGSC